MECLDKYEEIIGQLHEELDQSRSTRELLERQSIELNEGVRNFEQENDELRHQLQLKESQIQTIQVSREF